MEMDGITRPLLLPMKYGTRKTIKRTGTLFSE
jgi:hypothetical protein